MQRIYLDNAATTQPSFEVLKAMNEVNEKYWGNPSSVHSVGQEANQKLHEAREKVADFLNCGFQEVIFTSGGSESDNLAIKGIVDSFNKFETLNPKSETNSKFQIQNSKPHIITSAVEHHAVLHTVQDLEKEGKIEATYLRPNKDGVIEPEAVGQAIKENTVLVSIMYVNNETGVMNPIKEIAEAISGRESVAGGQKNKPQTTNHKPQTGKSAQQIYFHTDAVQAASFLPMDVRELGVDLLTLTAHKIHGPKGIGVLYVKEGTPLKSQITGGGHEFRRRAGTENLAGIAGLAAAIPSSKEQVASSKEVERLRDKLIDKLLSIIPNSRLNGEGAPRAPHIANISFINAEGEAIILNLDFLGIAVSSGSACTSQSLEPSHVLTAMGIPAEIAHGSIRFSLSRETTEEEIDKVIESLPAIIAKLRQMSPFE